MQRPVEKLASAELRTRYKSLRYRLNAASHFALLCLFGLANTQIAVAQDANPQAINPQPTTAPRTTLAASNTGSSPDRTTGVLLSHPIEPANMQALGLADSSYRFIARQFDYVADSIDNFLGGRHGEAGDAESFVRLQAGHTWDEERGNNSKVRLRGRVHLPRIEKRLSLVFSGDNNDDLVEAGDIDNPDIENNENSGVDLQYNAETGIDRSEFKLKAGFRSGLNPRLSARYRYSLILTDNFRLRVTEEPYWQSDRGFGALTRLDIDRVLSESSHLRWSNRGDFGEDTDGLDWDSLLTLAHKLDKKTTISYYTGVTGITRPEYITTRYEVGMLLRRNFWRRWFFVELEPAFLWRKDEESKERENGPAVTLRVEIMFNEELMR